MRINIFLKRISSAVKNEMEAPYRLLRYAIAGANTYKHEIGSVVEDEDFKNAEID
jgi:hypothetical protein